jgi:hypothetical protein
MNWIEHLVCHRPFIRRNPRRRKPLLDQNIDGKIGLKWICQLTPWHQIPQVHRRIYKNSPPAPILSQLDPLYNPKSISLRSIVIPSSYLRLGLPTGLFPSAFPAKTCTVFSPLPCVLHRLSTTVTNLRNLLALATDKGIEMLGTNISGFLSC